MPSFEEMLLETVDITLEQLGLGLRAAIYAHLVKHAGVRREEIPQDPARFDQALHTVFGSGADSVIQRLIVKGLAAKLRLPLEELGEAHFVDLLSRLRARHDELSLHR